MYWPGEAGGQKRKMGDWTGMSRVPPSGWPGYGLIATRACMCSEPNSAGW